MKEKFTLAIVAMTVTIPAWAQIIDGVARVPEPSTLALFASAAIAVVVARKFRK